jgi:uncharacterized protein (TIGR03437 family)
MPFSKLLPVVSAPVAKTIRLSFSRRTKLGAYRNGTSPAAVQSPASCHTPASLCRCSTKTKRTQGVSVVLQNYSHTRFYAFVVFLTFGSVLSAAPKLSLAQTALVLSVAPGSNGAAQSVDASNLGDGSLNLKAASSVPWLTPTIGQPHSCSIKAACTPVQIAVPSASLAKGTYTGNITVSDPNAVDAPQIIVVTLLVGGAVPDKLEFFLPPGGTATSNFTTGTKLSTTTVSDNTPWLSIAVNGTGTFTFNVPYQVTATAASGMAATDYNGSITLGGSSFQPDNKLVPVLLHVTTKPILQANPNALQIKIAQGANKQSSTNGALPYISTANTGQGTLAISTVSAAATTGGTWLSAGTVTGFPSLVSVTADPTGLSPNIYQGTVTIASNAANASVSIPVQLTIEAATTPVASAGGVVNNGTFATGESLAQGDIVAVFGDQFTYGDPQQAPSLPLNTTLGGTQVLVNGTAAPAYYVSPGQINFQVPIDASLGDGTVQVVRNGQKSNLVSIYLSDRQPRFILLGGGYVIMTTPQGALTGIPGHPVTAGDVVVIYAIGFGPTTPSVPSGTASPNPAAVVPDTRVCFGEHTVFTQPLCVTAAFSGLTPGLVGLYQINITVPQGLPKGAVPFFFTVAGAASDPEQIAVQ